MRELGQLLLCAKKYADISEFKNLIRKIVELKEYKLDWDDEAGEEWARFFNDNCGIVLMLNKKIGIVFLKKGCVSSNTYKILKEQMIVEVDSFDSDDWCINITKIKRDLPEINWLASDQAVNTKKMSLKDLYYATV